MIAMSYHYKPEHITPLNRHTRQLYCGEYDGNPSGDAMEEKLEELSKFSRFLGRFSATGGYRRGKNPALAYAKFAELYQSSDF
ncbi:MAG: hypothetical protein V1836_02820 [Candidatus Aenigmatarchaeota archaeon]